MLGLWHQLSSIPSEPSSSERPPPRRVRYGGADASNSRPNLVPLRLGTGSWEFIFSSPYLETEREILERTDVLRAIYAPPQFVDI